MSNGFIYVVDAHFIDKIEKKNISWTQVPVIITLKRKINLATKVKKIMVGK